MKKVNPEDLVVGQECYVKVRFAIIEKNQPCPLILIDCDKDRRVFSLDQPIYTLDDQPQHPDPELEMLVNVATALFNDIHFKESEIEEELGHKLSEDKEEKMQQWASAYKKLVAREAAYLIAACKQIKEVSND